ncbi:hypothetical protein HGA34_00975 [Candidatus Falkowbacteria bacterium]|nr:hypothetical protein [Candidatus Falkowbacteria bacterium]
MKKIILLVVSFFERLEWPQTDLDFSSDWQDLLRSLLTSVLGWSIIIGAALSCEARWLPEYFKSDPGNAVVFVLAICFGVIGIPFILIGMLNLIFGIALGLQNKWRIYVGK